MKRYGFKFENQDSGGTKFIELRFAITIFSTFGLLLSYIFSGEFYEEYYLGLWFVYLLLAFLPEVIRKTGIHLLLVCCIAASILAVVHTEHLFPDYIESSRYPFFRREKAIDFAGRNIFLLYNLAILLICYFYAGKPKGRS